MTRASFSYADYEMVPKPQSVYHKIFGARREYVVRKGYRGGTGSRLHMIRNWSAEESAHFLLHDAHGRQLQRDFPNVSFNDLVGYVCEASRRPTEKREVKTMDSDLKVIAKSENATHALCKHIAKSDGAGWTHPEFDDFLGKYASNKHPGLRLGTAIARVLASEMPVAKAYDVVHSAYHPAYAVAKAQPVVDDEDDEDEDESDTDALAELEELAREERRRSNGMLTKQQAFTKVFTDPANARLAQRERQQNRPR